MGRVPLQGSRTVAAQITSYLNEKYIDFKIGHLGTGVQVIMNDIPEKVWKGLIAPEFVRIAKEIDLTVAAAHYGSHTDGGISLEVVLSKWTAMDFARQGWLLTEPNVEGVDYYASPRM